MKYHKTGVIEAVEWSRWAIMDRISVSPHDRDNGSPKEGDWIAWAPGKPDDRWLISKEYFAANYEPEK
jgi:hypothetical protein